MMEREQLRTVSTVEAVSTALEEDIYALRYEMGEKIKETDLVLRFIAIFNNTAEAFTFEKKWHNRGREGENYAAQRSSKIDLRSIRQRCWRKRTGKVLFCKHLFDLPFAEASERDRKLRNSDESAWKEAKIVRCRSSAHPFTSGETAGYHLSGDH